MILNILGSKTDYEGNKVESVRTRNLLPIPTRAPVLASFLLVLAAPASGQSGAQASSCADLPSVQPNNCIAGSSLRKAASDSHVSSQPGRDTH